MIGLLSAMYSCSSAGSMIPAGMLIDAFGARRMAAAGGAVMGLARSPWARRPADPRRAGATTAGGARAYRLDAYRAAFAACAAFVLGATLLSLLLREPPGRNVWQELA